VSTDRLALLATLGALLVALAGLWQLVQARLDRAALARRSELDRVEFEASLWRSRADARLRRSSLGERLAAQSSRAGVGLSALDLLGLYLGAAGAGFFVGAVLGPTLLATITGAAGFWAVRRWLEWKRAARLEDFVSQLPELARTLSNATSAGRSLPSALLLAAEDLGEPAGSELRLLTEQLRIGQPVDEALEVLSERLPSRELGVLASTLVIQQRTGGDVVTALRDMASTLETRKDLRREVKTIVAGAVQTGYVTGGLGIGIVVLVSLVQPGMIDMMMRRPVGQITLIVAASLYALAITAMRRMTDIDI
jgi:tight adherence protein B